jgi:hypothetical protein
MEYEEKKNIVIRWRGEGKSKQQIKEDKRRKFYKENMEETKVKDFNSINKDRVLVEMEEWSGKESETKGKT